MPTAISATTAFPVAVVGAAPPPLPSNSSTDGASNTNSEDGNDLMARADKEPPTSKSGPTNPAACTASTPAQSATSTQSATASAAPQAPPAATPLMLQLWSHALERRTSQIDQLYQSSPCHFRSYANEVILDLKKSRFGVNEYSDTLPMIVAEEDDIAGAKDSVKQEKTDLAAGYYSNYLLCTHNNSNGTQNDSMANSKGSGSGSFSNQIKSANATTSMVSSNVTKTNNSNNAIDLMTLPKQSLIHHITALFYRSIDERLPSAMRKHSLDAIKRAFACLDDWIMKLSEWEEGEKARLANQNNTSGGSNRDSLKRKLSQDRGVESKKQKKDGAKHNNHNENGSSGMEVSEDDEDEEMSADSNNKLLQKDESQRKGDASGPNRSRESSASRKGHGEENAKESKISKERTPQCLSNLNKRNCSTNNDENDYENDYENERSITHGPMRTGKMFLPPRPPRSPSPSSDTSNDTNDGDNADAADNASVGSYDSMQSSQSKDDDEELPMKEWNRQKKNKENEEKEKNKHGDAPSARSILPAQSAQAAPSVDSLTTFHFANRRPVDVNSKLASIARSKALAAARAKDAKEALEASEMARRASESKQAMAASNVSELVQANIGSEGTGGAVEAGSAVAKPAEKEAKDTSKDYENRAKTASSISFATSCAANTTSTTTPTAATLPTTATNQTTSVTAPSATPAASSQPTPVAQKAQQTAGQHKQNEEENDSDLEILDLTEDSPPHEPLEARVNANVVISSSSNTATKNATNSSTPQSQIPLKRSSSQMEPQAQPTQLAQLSTVAEPSQPRRSSASQPTRSKHFSKPRPPSPPASPTPHPKMLNPSHLSNPPLPPPKPFAKIQNLVFLADNQTPPLSHSLKPRPSCAVTLDCGYHLDGCGTCLEDRACLDITERLRKWDPYWKIVHELGRHRVATTNGGTTKVGTRTTSCVPTQSQLPVLAMEYPTSAAVLSIDLPKEANSVPSSKMDSKGNPLPYGSNSWNVNWGFMCNPYVNLRTDKYTTGVRRLIVRMLPLHRSGYDERKRADTHVWPKGSFLQLSRGKPPNSLLNPNSDTSIALLQRRQQAHDPKLWKGMSYELDLTPHVPDASVAIALKLCCREVVENVGGCGGSVRLMGSYALHAAICEYVDADDLYDQLMGISQDGEVILPKVSLRSARKLAKAYLKSQTVSIEDSDDEDANNDDSGTDDDNCLTFSLLCPLTKTAIETPVRGRNCKHMQCFDLRNFLHANKTVSGSRWRCGVCEDFISVRDLVHCGMFQAMLNDESIKGKVSGVRDRVGLRSDGTWWLMDENKLRYAPKRGGEGGSGGVGNVVSSNVGIKSISLEEEREKSAKEPEVIDLL